VAVVVLGLLAAVLYGVGDFVGALASRRSNPVTVLLRAYPVGAVLITLLVPFFPGQATGHVVVFGMLGGMVGMVGVMLMYTLMAVAPMNIISPITAVLAAMVPVVFGVLVGERPQVAAWLGILLGLVAITLVSRTTDDHPHGRLARRMLIMAFLSGVGFGGYFIFLARAGHGSGLWPLVISRYTAFVLIAGIAIRRGVFTLIRNRTTLALAVLSGICDAGANMSFLLASRHGLLSLASVLTSLYPAATVILAMTFLHEHASKVQRIGLALAAASVVLITV
jgi:drug/metabolite transporter (DMT)-like permease